MKYLVLLFLVVSVKARISDEELAVLKSNLRVTVIEDHPWVIKNETCMATVATDDQKSCYRGYLIGLLDVIVRDLGFNYTMTETVGFGKLDKTKTPPEWSGLIGMLARNETDIGLASFNITTERQEVMSFSEPFINNSDRNITYALGFPKGSKLVPGFSHMVKKLVNQRHTEQLLELWFHECRAKDGCWDAAKQISKY